MPKVGQIIKYQNWAYRVDDFRSDKTVVWTNYGNKSTAKGKFVGVFLSIVNVGDKTMGLNSWDFELTDSKGLKYSPDFEGTYAYREKFDLFEYDGSYPPSTVVKTVIGFDVAPDAEGFRILFKQGNLFIVLEKAQ